MLRALPLLLLAVWPSTGFGALVRSVEPAPVEAAPATPSARREITALPASCEITIDGHFDERCWQVGLWIDEFVLSDGSGKRPAAQTLFKVRFDEQNLYVAVRAAEPSMEHLKGFYGATHDDQAFNDDCIEVWLDPDDLGRRAYHQVYSVVGGTYDTLQCEQGQSGAPRRTQDTSWEAHGEVVFARSEDQWTCEMRLPVSDLGLDTIIPGSVWGFNLARERWAFVESGRAEYSSLTGVFCWPMSAFAKLRLGVPEVDVTAFDFGAAGVGDNELRFECRDPRGNLATLDMRLTIQGHETTSYRHSIRLKGSEAKLVVLPYEIPGPGEYALRLELLRPGSDEVLFRKTMTRRLESAVRLHPRSHIARIGAEPWWVDVELQVGDVSLQEAQLRVELLKADGRRLAHHTVEDVQRRSRLHLNLRRARAEGEYVVRVTVVSRGKELGEGTVPLRMIRAPR